MHELRNCIVAAVISGLLFAGFLVLMVLKHTDVYRMWWWYEFGVCAIATVALLVFIVSMSVVKAYWDARGSDDGNG